MGIFQKFFPSGRSPQEVARLFPSKDRQVVERFYYRFGNERFLVVSFGDGVHEFDASSFFQSASIYFHREPIEVGAYIVLANDSEDELSCVVLEKSSGTIFLAYDISDVGDVASDYRVELAPSFSDFLSAMEAAGWNPWVGDDKTG